MEEGSRVELVDMPTLERHVERFAPSACELELRRPREQLDLQLEPDLAQIRLHDLAGRGRGCPVGAVQDALSRRTVRVAARELAGLRQIGPGRIDVGVVESRHRVGQVLVGDDAGEGAALLEQRHSVDRMVHGLLERTLPRGSSPGPFVGSSPNSGRSWFIAR